MRTRLGCVPLTYDREFFPIAQTLVLEHRHKLVKSPIIIHQAVKVLVRIVGREVCTCGVQLNPKSIGCFISEAYRSLAVGK
jgi:hypothetical protein